MSELIKHFGIDWKLLLAQAINFLILLFLLKKFAYRPILSILQKRREEIEKGLKFKEKAEDEFKKIKIIEEQTLDQAKEEALHIVLEGEKRAEVRKGEIVETAHQKAQSIIEEAKKHLEEERAKLGEAVYQNAQSFLKQALVKIIKKSPEDEKSAVLIREAVDELKKEVL